MIITEQNFLSSEQIIQLDRPRVSIINEREDLQFLQKTLKAWKTAIEDRFGESRIWNGTDNQEKFDTDLKSRNSYKDVLNLIKQRIENSITCRNNNQEIPVIITLSANDQIQGVAVATIESIPKKVEESAA